ncbi:MAG: GYD domain-containing protein, partial [Rubrobacter sp.]
GPYDLVSILEAPDDESATAMVLDLVSGGNLRTTTLRAYDREEMSGIVQRLS